MIQPLLETGLGQKNVQNFVGFLGDWRTWYFAFDTYWPLVHQPNEESKHLFQKYEYLSKYIVFSNRENWKRYEFIIWWKTSAFSVRSKGWKEGLVWFYKGKKAWSLFLVTITLFYFPILSVLSQNNADSGSSLRVVDYITGP